MLPQRAPRHDDDDTPARTGGGGGDDRPGRTRGPAEVIPFPMWARVAMLDRTAELAASYREPSRYLASFYRQQEQSLRRRGFADDIVQSEMATLAREVEARIAEWVLE